MTDRVETVRWDRSPLLQKEEKAAAADKVKEKNEDSDREPAEETKDPEAAAAEDSAEDLKRLGIS